MDLLRPPRILPTPDPEDCPPTARSPTAGDQSRVKSTVLRSMTRHSRLEGRIMKGKITCHLCQRAIAEHRRGELCWLNALANGIVRPLVAKWQGPMPERSTTQERVAAAN